MRGQGKDNSLDEPVWVKFSTGFKKELATLDVYSLKVFLYIGLSVNFETGDAFPGVRKIAEDTGMDKGTVVKAVAKLEELGFLTVVRKDGDTNKYKPVRYISIGTVRPERTPGGELYGEKAELYGESGELYGAQEGNLHNKNNKIKQEEEDDETKIAAKLKNLTHLYETTIGAITPLMADLLRNAAIDYPEEWFEPAFEVAVKNNARRWIYVETILDGWKRNGFGWKPASVAPTRSKQIFARSFNPRREQNGEDRPRYKIPDYSEAELATIDEINRLSTL